MTEVIREGSEKPMQIPNPGVDLEFLEREFKFAKGLDLLTLADFSLIFPDFSGNSPRK